MKSTDCKKKQIKLLGGVIYQPFVNVLNMWLLRAVQVFNPSRAKEMKTLGVQPKS